MRNTSVNGELDYGDTQDSKDCLRGYQEMEYPVRECHMAAVDRTKTFDIPQQFKEETRL